MPETAACLADRLVAVVLPGSGWLGVLTSHIEWAMTAAPDEIAAGDRTRVARQIRLLYAAAIEGASPAQDDLVTEMRDLVDVACEALGHAPDAEDTRLAARCVMRHDALQSLIQKLTRMALPGLSPKDL